MARPDRSAFLPSRAMARPSPLAQLSLQEVHEIRLLLRGDSVVDWHRMGLRNEEDVRRLLAVNSIDIDNEGDLSRLASLRNEGVRYIRETLGLRLSEHIAELEPRELFLLASGRGRYQREACTLLKVMHIIYHLDARELRKSLPIPDVKLFTLVEESIGRLFDQLRDAGVPVVEFAWSRKTKHSLVTKLLVKQESYAATVFDRLRFRLVVDRAENVLPTLHVMLQRFIPFNYVMPNQTVNSLVEMRPLQRRVSRARDFSVAAHPTTPIPANEFSGRGYQTLNFVADLPVRVDPLLEKPSSRGAIVFVLAEFQIVDSERAAANERGDSSHVNYKHRQHQRVRERLLREPRQKSRRSG